MDNNIKLSIIIPMYNVEKYIGFCIDSLLNQNVSQDEYEILIINDGSIDSSEKVIENYMKSYENINIISVKNGGQSYARNIGIDNARGKYLFFVDADDYISKGSIKEVLNKTIELNLDMMFFDLKRVYNELEVNCEYNKEDNISVVTGVNYFANNNVNNGPWHFFISKEFVERNNIKFIEGRYCEDGMFLISSIFNAKKVSHYDADIYRYVIRPNSTTTKRSKEHLIKMIEDFMYAIDYINNYYKESLKKGYSEEFLERLISRRNSYIYFMQIRMIKSRVGFSYAIEIIKRLKDINCYKYKRMKKSEYKDWKTTIVWLILNSKFLFCSLC